MDETKKEEAASDPGFAIVTPRLDYDALTKAHVVLCKLEDELRTNERPSTAETIGYVDLLVRGIRNAVRPKIEGSTDAPVQREYCTLETCGHMRQLDDIATLLSMPRGTRSVLDELRAMVRDGRLRLARPVGEAP